MLRLVLAIPRYNPTRGKIDDFIGMVARNEVRSQRRSLNYRMRDRRRTTPMGDFNPADKPVVHFCETREEEAACWKTIRHVGTEREQLVASMAFRDGKTYRQIGQTIGLSKPAIAHVMGKLFAKVRLEANRSVGENVINSSAMLVKDTN